MRPAHTHLTAWASNSTPEETDVDMVMASTNVGDVLTCEANELPIGRSQPSQTPVLNLAN